jgi:PAS domain S-box-containing protein
MDSDEREEEALRSSALESVKSIAQARQRAERELVAAKEALEQKAQELARSLAMVRATLESSFDGILVTDGNGRVTEFNERYLAIWGLPRERVEFGEHNCLMELCAPQLKEPERYLNRIAEINATRVLGSADIFQFKDGRTYERFSAVQYVDEQIVGRVWTFRDVTAQKRAEFELRQQREWFQVTLASIGDSVITTDTLGRVTFLNPVAEQMTGWKTTEALGLPLESVFNIVNEYSLQRVENPVGKVLREGLTIGLANHTLLVARDGTEIAIEDSAAPIRDLNGNICGAVMVFHDVTTRRRAELALREADRRKDEFLATLAHELRNPLAPIRQAALISKAPGATEAQKRWSHDIIERQVRNMALLLDDLLDISRVTRGTLTLRMEETDLASMIDAAVEIARPLIDAKRHKLSIDIRNKHQRFNADPLRIAQVLANLLTNAAKYTDPQGQISLSADCESEQVVIRVADNGIGVSPESMPKIFEMFAQVSSSREKSEGGLGIGLALTRGLIDLHGGSIEGRSAGLGRGSEFTVRFPIKTRDIESDAASVPRPIAAPATLRILLADDNRDAAESLAALLQIDGHDVAMVHDGPAAIEAFARIGPELALLDIGMPGLNGYEVAKRIRQSHPDSAAKLVAITGWGQDDDKTRAIEAGFDYHLTKPVELERLTEIMRRLSPRGAAATPISARVKGSS